MTDARDHARYGATRLDAGGTYDEIIAEGTPSASQVKNESPFGYYGIKADAGGDVTIETIELLNPEEYDGESWVGKVITADTYEPVRFKAVKFSAGAGTCYKGGPGKNIVEG